MSDGKWAEAQVQATLKSLSAELGNFDWQRLYDAHSAGGRIPAQVGDFLFFLPGEHGVIEVKETGSPDKLKRSNFGDQQLALMRIRQLCGGHVWVTVFHTEIKEWTVVSLEALQRQLEKSDTVNVKKIGTTFGNILDGVMHILQEVLTKE